MPISQKALEPNADLRQDLNKKKRYYRSACNRIKVIVEILQSEDLATYGSMLAWSTTSSLSSEQLSKAEAVSAIYYSAQ